MALIATALGLLAVLAIGYLLLRSRLRRRPAAPEVVSYEEIKRRIRAGAVDGPVCVPREPKPPLPLDEILEVDDSNRFVSSMFERVAHKAELGDPPLSASESAILHIYGLEAEVNNGGFDQYFFNSAGDGAARALAGLQLIGAAKAADIVRRAMAVFGSDGPAPDREARWLQMDRLDDAAKATLDRLSDEFQGYPDPLADLVMSHCREQLSQFS